MSDLPEDATQADITRKVELWLCDALKALLPLVRFFPSKGGGVTGALPGESIAQINNAVSILPPFAVVQCEQPESRISGESTFQGTVNVVYVSQIDDTTTPAHSAVVRQIYLACTQLRPGLKSPQALMVHGVDIADAGNFDDSDSQVHGDVTVLAVGVSG